MERALLDARQVARRLHVSRSYVYFLMRVGELPHIRLGNSLRVQRRDLEEFVRGRGPRPLPALIRRRRR